MSITRSLHYAACVEYSVKLYPAVGCGTGSLSIPLALKGAEVYGSDISSAMVHLAPSSADHPAPCMSNLFGLCA